MDETTGKNKIVGGSGEAWVVLFFLLVLFIFLLVKYGKGTSKVVNNDVVNGSSIELQSRQEIFEELKSENNSELYNKYLDKIEKLGQEGSDFQDLTGSIGEEYKRELQNKVILPEFNTRINGKIVGNSYTEKAKYLNEFENLFTEFSARNNFIENKILASQISNTENTILELSDYDKETILRMATEYEIWANKILSLETPLVYERKSQEAAKSILGISFVLKQIVSEKDMQVYPMWITKYIENIFDILANRYAK